MRCLECDAAIAAGKRKYCSNRCARKTRNTRHRGSEYTRRSNASEPERELPYDEHERYLRDVYDDAASSVVFLSLEVRWCFEDDARRFSAMLRQYRS